MPAAKSDLPPLSERYIRAQGRVHLTGLQALVRLPLEQLRRDRAQRQLLVQTGDEVHIFGLEQAFHAPELLVEAC